MSRAIRPAISTTVDVADLDEAVARFASESGVSVKAVLHAAHLKVLSQLTTEQSFHAGLVCDARPEVLGADRVQGMYLNTLPFGYERTARTWRDLVTAVFDREVDLWPHRRFPLAEIQRGSGQRLLRVLFNYQDFSRAGQSATATGTEPVVVGSAGDGATEFELSVFAHRGNYQLSSRSDVLSRANLERLAGMYRAVLAAMVADPAGDAQAVHLPGGERERLLGVVDTGVEEPVTGTVVELFAGSGGRRTRRGRGGRRPDPTDVRAGQTRRPTGSPGTCGPSVWAGARWSVSAWIEVRTWCPPCSACSRPVPPTCRWTRPSRPSASRTCSPTRPPGRWSPRVPTSTRSPVTTGIWCCSTAPT